MSKPPLGGGGGGRGLGPARGGGGERGGGHVQPSLGRRGRGEATGSGLGREGRPTCPTVIHHHHTRLRNRSCNRREDSRPIGRVTGTGGRTGTIAQVGREFR